MTAARRPTRGAESPPPGSVTRCTRCDRRRFATDDAVCGACRAEDAATRRAADQRRRIAQLDARRDLTRAHTADDSTGVARAVTRLAAADLGRRSVRAITDARIHEIDASALVASVRDAQRDTPGE